MATTWGKFVKYIPSNISFFSPKKCLITCMGHESQNGKKNLQETLVFEAKGEMFQLFFPMNIMNQSKSMVRSCQIYNSNNFSSLTMENGSFIGDLRVNPWFPYGKSRVSPMVSSWKIRSALPGSNPSPSVAGGASQSPPRSGTAWCWPAMRKKPWGNDGWIRLGLW